MITLNRNILFPSIWILSILAAIASMYTKNNGVVALTTFLFYITVPGFILLRTFAFKNLGFWNNLVLTVGLSIFILIVPGLLFNWLMPLFRISTPLQTTPLAIYFLILNTLLLIVSYFRNEHLSYIFNFKINLLKKIYFIIPPIVTLLSIFASNQLNNTNNNTLIISVYSLLAVSILITIIFFRKIDENFLPWSLYFYSLSLLLSVSLRSNYVSGWDIQSEFKMFQVTKSFGVWSPENWDHAYNACLSITLLPTIISRLTSFADDHIYKLFYQIIFATSSVVIFQLFKRYASGVISFIAVVYVISQPLFILPMTALMRQEISLLFFVLILFVVFNSSIPMIKRWIIFSMLGFAMVVSHYSTTYVTLLLFLLSYPFIGMFQLSERIPFLSNLYYHFHINDITVRYKYYLNPVLIIILFIFTFFWYGYINNHLGKVQQVASDGLAEMNTLFKSDIQSEETKLATTFLNTNNTTSQEIEEYTQSVLSKMGGAAYRLYPPETYQNSNVTPLVFRTTVPILNIPYNRNIIISLELLKQVLKFCVILSPLYLLLVYFRNNKIPREYIFLSGTAVFIIAIMTFHPSLGLEYNLSRFYLQLLFFLSLPAILLFNFVFYPLKKYAVVVSGLFIVILFSYLNGLFYQFLGGEARMYFNNFGSDFDKFYVHKEELYSAGWLKEQVSSKSTVFADMESNLRISRIVDRGINYDILPALIFTDAYVYGSYANTVNNLGIIHNGGSLIVISFPQKFLNENKNVIYSNGGSKIYR